MPLGTVVITPYKLQHQLKMCCSCIAGDLVHQSYVATMHPRRDYSRILMHSGRRAPGLGIILLAAQMMQYGFHRIPPVTLSAILGQVFLFLNPLNMGYVWWSFMTFTIFYLFLFLNSDLVFVRNYTQTCTPEQLDDIKSCGIRPLFS